MRGAEEVTFGTGRLDRAANERSKATWDGTARSVIAWRGKLALEGGGAPRLATVPVGHPILAHAGPSLFVGRADGAALWAHDISAWDPEGQDTTTLGAFLDPSEQVHPDLPDARFAELRAVMTRLARHDAEVAATARALFEWHRTHGYCAMCGTKTRIAEGGWRTECPGCGRHHFPRTDPVVIMLILHGNSVLVGRSPGWPERMFSLLAGFVEPGETLEAAVRREVFEETAVRVGEVGYLASQPWPFPASLMFGCIGRATSTEIEVDPVEIEAARWVSREEMVEAMAGRHPEIAGAREGAIAHFLLQKWLSDDLA
ncbi:MAG: NAD(+) diphosphatase [Shimia sp.]